MISVPNHLPRLSGNKICTALLFSIIALSGCKALRPVQAEPKPKPKRETVAKPRNNDAEYLPDIQPTLVYDPVKQQWVRVISGPRAKMDTLQYAMLTNTPRISSYPSYPPRKIKLPAPSVLPKPAEEDDWRTRGWVPVEKKNTYKIALALPFSVATADGGSSTNADSRVAAWALNFYAGLKLAGPLLEEEGISIEVQALDTRADGQAMASLLGQQAMQEADVIIGPYRRENIRMAADFAQKNKKVLVSPYSAVSGLVEKNPGFIQVSPSLESHCRAQLQHALREFVPEEILLISRENPAEKTCVDFLQKANLDFAGNPQAQPLRTLNITNTSYAGISVAPALKGREQVAIIIPSWADQNFVFFLLRRIAEAKTENQRIAVYGMPQWMEYENFEYEYFERLHVRVSSHAFLDPLDEGVKAFRKSYFNTYGTVPNMAAFQGYDLFLYLGRMLMEYGVYFQYYMPKNPGHYLHTWFEFKPVLVPGAASAELSDNILSFENRYVHILEFRDYQFSALR
ncbi:MAG: ABC transporter substrate-binding protein [Saprospiraceae bacterium]